MYTIIYTDINNKTNVKSLQKPPIDQLFFSETSARFATFHDLASLAGRAGRGRLRACRPVRVAAFPRPAARGRRRARARDVREARAEPLVVLVDRHVDDALATELDGGADVRSAHLPRPERLDRLEETEDVLLARLQLPGQKGEEREARVTVRGEQPDWSCGEGAGGEGYCQGRTTQLELWGREEQEGRVTVRGELPNWSCGEGKSRRGGLLSGENYPTGAVGKGRAGGEGYCQGRTTRLELWGRSGSGGLLSGGTECWEREGRTALKVPQGKGRTGWSGLLSGGTQCWEREGRVTLKVLQPCGEEKGRGWEGREVILSGYPSANPVDENVF